MIKAVVFDLDGTLLNTLEDLMDSCNYAIAKYGYKKITLAETKAFIGNGIKKLIERSLKGDLTYLEECYEAFKEYYYVHCNIHTKKYPGIDELIDYLISNNIKIGVVSNKRYDTLNLLVHAHFQDKFKEIIGDGEGLKRKPEPDTIIEMARRLEVDINELAYVGDSNVDVETVKNSGSIGLFVDYGFRDRDVLIECGARNIFSSPLEIKSYLMREK